jgi:hypothetical protein
VKHLRGLPDLSSLDLARTKVTDEGLAHLGACKELRHLDLTGTRVTAAGVADLQKKPPELKVQR